MTPDILPQSLPLTPAPLPLHVPRRRRPHLLVAPLPQRETDCHDHRVLPGAQGAFGPRRLEYLCSTSASKNVIPTRCTYDCIEDYPLNKDDLECAKEDHNDAEDDVGDCFWRHFHTRN